jgi:hypothetical protein
MLDASKYAEHFPDERQAVLSVQATAAAALAALPPPPPGLLAALGRLEREFSEILRAQQPDATERSD